MAELERRYDVITVDSAGKRAKGVISARSEEAVFERLRREGLSPVRIRAAQGATKARAKPRTALTERRTAGFLADLAALLKAGADVRAALSILGAKSGHPSVQALCRKLSTEISGGGALDQAFARNLAKEHDFVAALVAAGEASGDLAGGLQRAAEMLESRIKLRDQLVSVLAYPAFVFISTVLAVAVILIFVVPSLAPLARDGGAEPPIPLQVMIAVSEFLRGNGTALTVFAIVLLAGCLAAGRAGLLDRPLDRLMVDGPARKTSRALLFGGFAIAFGNMLAAGAPMGDALRLAVRSIRSGLARQRLEPAVQAVRQGQSLSTALGRVAGFPETVTRLAAVGEASGALGVMLARAGKIEEDAAIRRIEAIGRILGPALIVALGGLVGLLMASLLTGVTQLGKAALL